MRANPFAAADQSPPSALGLRRRAAPVRVLTAAVREDDSDGDSPPARPLERLSARGALLLLASVASFAAFALLSLAELAPLAAPRLLRPAAAREVHSAALWVLVAAAPATAAAAWLPVSVASAGGQLRIRSPAGPSGAQSLAAAVRRSFRRNRMFAVYQGVAWTLYGLVLALAAACAATGSPSYEAAGASNEVSAVFAEASALWFCVPGGRSTLAVLAFIAEELVISSVLALEHRRDRNLRGPRDRFVVQLNNFNNMLLLVSAVGLAAASEFARHADHAPSAYPLSAGVGSLMLFITALLNTYGLGGVLSTKNGWRFYQPFTGGTRFVAFQVVSWTCFGAGLFIQGLYLVSLVVVELELFVGAMLAAGALFATSEVVMMMSLLVFRKSDANRTRGSFEQRLHNFADECLGVLVVGGLANIQFIPNALMFVYFAATTNLGPLGVAFYALTAFMIEFFMVISRSIGIHLYNKDSLYGERTEINKYHVKYVLPRLITGITPAVFTYHHYVNDLEPFYSVFVLTAATYIYEFTYRGNPQQSGTRMRPHWVTGKSVLIDKVKQYFSGQILTSGPPLDPNGQYIMAFHPHGIMPLSVMWLQFTDAWRQLFPNVYAHILTASVLHQIPLARDVLQFFGGREVTRQAFVETLKAKESVMLVPGGQAEMLQQQSGIKEIRVYTHHKGFIRLAVEHGVSLVPVLSFHEGEIMDNVRAPALQQWFIKKLGFPFPYIPYGRGMLPVPRKTDVTVAVGSPLAVEKVENPSQEVVDKVHAEYFSRVEALFHEHKKAANCEDVKLVLL